MALAVLLTLAGCTARVVDPDMSDSPAPAPNLAAATVLVEATVTRGIDGTSLDTRINGGWTAVGYLGAEVPFPNQPCGEEALACRRELAGNHVLLEEDSAYPFDGSDQLLYYLFIVPTRLRAYRLTRP